MKYKIVEPMAKDFPEAVELAFAQDIAGLVDLVINRCAVDTKGNPVDLDKLTLADKMALIQNATEMITSMLTGGEEGND